MDQKATCAISVTVLYKRKHVKFGKFPYAFDTRKQIICIQHENLPHSTSCATHLLPQQLYPYRCYQPQRSDPVCSGNSASIVDGSAHIQFINLHTLHYWLNH